ncbi:MAG: PQQ-binding-like beta-propeller repeat protein [bacterium]
MNRWTLLLAAVLLMLAGCGGTAPAGGPAQTAGQPVLNPASGLPAMLELPAIPQERAASYSPAKSLNGAQFMEQQGGLVISDSLLLSSAAGHISWSIYGLRGFSGLHRISLEVRDNGTDSYWLAIADYGSGSWKFSGPHASSTVMDQSLPGQLSPLGNIYVAVVSHDGANAIIDRLELQMLNPPPSAMAGIDPRNTGRSPHTGPQAADFAAIQGPNRDYGGTPLIGSDGSIYLVDGQDLLALNPDLTKKWSYRTGAQITTTPALAPDGSICFAGPQESLVVLNPDGSLRWAEDLSPGSGASITTDLTVDADGNIYIGSSSGFIYALDRDGAELWKHDAGSKPVGSVALADDASLYAALDSGKLLALDAAGAPRWDFPVGLDLRSAPVIADDGTVYCTSRVEGLFAVNPDGTQKWNIKTDDDHLSSVALATDGTVYLAADDGFLYALDPQNGQELWAYDSGSGLVMAPVVDAAGTIHVANLAVEIHAVNPDGSMKWVAQGPFELEGHPPAISADGRLYITILNNGLHVIGPGNSGPPEVQFTLSHTGVTPTEVLLDATGTSDADGIASYYWLFGDGTAQSTETPSVVHDYVGLVGDPECTVLVTDKKGLITVARSSIHVPTTWGMLGGSGQHTGLAYHNGPALGGEAWWFETTGNVRSSPAIAADGTIFFGCDNGWFYAFNPDGTEKWKKNIGNIFLTNSPAIGGNGTVYFAAQNNELHAVNPEDGSEYWSRTTDAGVTTSISLMSMNQRTILFFGCSDGQVYWMSEYWNPSVISSKSFSISGTEVKSTPAVLRGLYSPPALVGSDSADIFNTFTEASEFTADSAIRSHPVLGYDDALCFGTLNGTVYHNGGSGDSWTYSGGSAISGSPALGPDGSVYFATVAGKLIALDAAGAFRWEVDNGAPGRSSPVVGANGIIYCAFGNLMYSYNPDGSERWSYDSFGPIYSTPAIDHLGRLVFGSDDDVLLVLGSN